MKNSLNDKLHKGFVFGLLFVAFVAFLGSSMAYTQTNLVSNISGLANVTDTNAVNSWGIAHLPTGPWWVADNGMGVSTVYNGNGTPFPVGNPLVVTVPGLDNNSATPTGIVANNESVFNVTAGNPAKFVFVTEDGTISAWNPNVDPTKAILMVNNSPDAVYKGVTIDKDTNGTFLYAANFRQGRIDIFDTDFKSVTMDTSAFVDSQIPAGFAPFNIQMVDGNLVVTFAQPDSDKHDEVDGPGLGYVDIFDPDGKLIMRLEHGDWLNAPWGVTMSPANFGNFSNDLIIGNFGSGQISAFDSDNGSFKGLLDNESNKPIVIDGLWGLGFGNDANAGSSDTLFFAAGLNKEQDGLFGNIAVSEAVSRPSELTLTLNATMDGTGPSTVDAITSAVLLNTAGSTIATATLPDNMTAQFALNGISPGDYFIEVNHLAGDRVPTRIDSNESDINQSVGTRLRNSVIGSISNPTYRIKSRLGGRHQIVNYITGANETEVPYIIVSANPQKIEVREFNTSRELTNFTAKGAHPTGDSFQTWILGSNNHGINYNGTDSKCNGCHGNLSTKAPTFSAITTNDGMCYRCHYGKGGDGNGFVDPAQPITDTIPPTTAISGVTENGSFNNSVTITLNATDNVGGAGVNETIYMVNGGATTTYSAPFVVDTRGADNVTYWSTDNAGNVEPQNMVNFTIGNISLNDTTAPTTTISGVTENGSFNNSVTITLNATDNAGGAGVNETIYMVNGGATTTYSAPFVVDTIGQDNVTYWSTDNAGNVEPQNMVNFTIVSISEVNATATREIGKKSILPGESTNITVRIAGITKATGLHEIPPEGWNVTRGSDNADGFKNNTNEWVWISSEANKTVTYTLTAPMNISIGTYQIEGTIRDVNGTLANVEGDNSVKIDILEVYRRLGDDPAVVETGDLLSAFDDFRNNKVPSPFDRALNAEEVAELINEWINS